MSDRIDETDTTIIFGTNWSLDTWDIRNFLDDLEVEFEFYNIEANPKALAWLKQHVDADAIRFPALRLTNGSLLLTPSKAELETAFHEHLPVEKLKIRTQSFRPIKRDDTEAGDDPHGSHAET